MSKKPGIGAGIVGIAAVTPPQVRDNSWFSAEQLA